MWDKRIDPAAIQKIPATLAAHYDCMPVAWDGQTLQVLMEAMPDLEKRDEMRSVFEAEVLIWPTPQADIRKHMREHYGLGADTLQELAHAKEFETRTDLQIGTDLDVDQEASVARLVNQMLLEAFESRATDIHLQPSEDDFRVRYRIDGMLYEARIAESLKRYQAAITSRVKILAELSISESRLPQDGRIVVRVAGTEMDLRVSTLPTPFGESIGIRFLTSRGLLDLSHLGFADEDLRQLEAVLSRPHGIILLTGPTGSGKTTTLYAFLKRMNTTAQNIITLEDPVEYQMKGITQIQVHPKIGLTFAHGLRAMLRHDPDVMMVGEIRDLETAEIAIRVALTGHLVFSTLHTNDAPGAVTRLQDIGVEPYLISSSVVCMIAQRLVRVICPDCRTPIPLSPELYGQFDLPKTTKITVYKGTGCAACKQTGYLGRTVIYEIFPMTAAAQELIGSRAPAETLRERAITQGMRTLRQCGWKKVLDGITTPEEVIRATLQEAK